MTMRCMNCNESLKLDASIVEKYPEWQSLSKQHHARKKNSTSSVATVGSGSNGSRRPAPGTVSEEFASSAKNDVAHCEDFVVPPQKSLNEEQTADATRTLSNFIVTSGNLFDMICNGATAIEHPLCQECADRLLDCMDQQLNELEEECTEYTALLDNLRQAEGELDLPSLKLELEKAKSEEAELLAELERLELEERQQDEKLEEGDKEIQQLKAEEEVLWKTYRDLSRQCIEYEQDNLSINNQLKYAQEQLDKLTKTNVFNLCFHIWHNGYFGTINGLRLGRLPNVTVDWHEINAAWGQTCLLLYALARKIKLQFLRYELVPMGNFSFARCLDDNNKELPLYCSGGYKFFWDTKFDAAMVAFLDCLQQFKEAIEKGDGQFCMPYRIQKDKIIMEENGLPNEYSVKIQFNSEERWTKAMKFMLTDMKWALAWVSSQYCQ